MHPAIIKRAEKLVAEGKDPGNFYPDPTTGAPIEYKIGTNVVRAPTEFGKFEVELKTYPAVDEAWFYPDVSSLWRFL